MRQIIRATALVVLGCFVLPAFAADEKKADDKDKDVDKKAPEVVAAGSSLGKILFVDESKRTLKLQISVPELNPEAANGLAKAKLDLALAAQARTIQERNQKTQAALTAMAQHQRNLYREKKVDMDFTTTEDVKVRMSNPPTKFDEKGKVVSYTKDELKELKGDDPKLTGYKAEFGDLRQNQIVQIVLVKKKGTPKISKPVPGEKGKDVDKVAIADALAEYAPHASMIVIVAEPASR